MTNVSVTDDLGGGISVETTGNDEAMIRVENRPELVRSIEKLTGLKSETLDAASNTVGIRIASGDASTICQTLEETGIIFGTIAHRVHDRFTGGSGEVPF